MRKILITFILITVAVQLHSQSKKYYENGKLKEFGYFDNNGKEIGERENYYEKVFHKPCTQKDVLYAEMYILAGKD